MTHRTRLAGLLAALVALAAVPVSGTWALAKVTHPARGAGASARPNGNSSRIAPRASDAQAAASVTVSPLPGDTEALPRTQISFLGAPPAALQGITVVGSKSGTHSGRLSGYQSAIGASFLPDQPFRVGEHVTVHATLSAPAGPGSLSTSFTVAQPAPVHIKGFPAMGNPKSVQHFHTQPSFHPTTIAITRRAQGSAPGLLFTSPDLGAGQFGPMIFDDAGQIVWFHPLGAKQSGEDFRTQTYAGKPVLTWWEGRLLQFGYGLGTDMIYDTAYHRVASVRAGNGLSADGHEFLLTPRGSALITAYSPVAMSAASVRGPKDATVLDGVIQEIDVATGLVMYEWHSLDQVALSESYSPPPKAKPAHGVFDYFHINSIDVDASGNLLVSARNTWTIYGIATHTGGLLFRVSGKKPTLKSGRGVPFAFQHNALWLPNGQISLFDDECCAAPAPKKPGVKAPPLKGVHGPSRGEIINLDLVHHTATLAQQFIHTGGKALVTASQGNLQPLPNGNWLEGLGGQPNFTEYNARGQIVFDGTLSAKENDYRVFRNPWTAQPSTVPDVAATASAATMRVYASWNGATAVAAWQVLSGASPSTLTPGPTRTRAGFETTISAATSAYVAVRALSPSGAVLATSRPVAVGH